MKKLKENKILKTIFKALKVFCIAFFVVFLAVVIVQRVTNNNLSIGGFRVFTVISESMVPEYQIGDILIVKSVDANTIKVGDDICYLGEEEEFKDKVVTHRVKRINNENNELEFITEGIANVMEDPPVSEDQIYGKVIYKTYILSLMSKLASNTVTFFLLIFIPIAIFIILEVKDLVGELINKRLETEEAEDEDEE